MIKNKRTLSEAKNIYFLEYNEKEASIGEYQEKAIHSILKHYFEDDLSKQEQKCKKYIADIINEYGIIEIQTRSFDKMRAKLNAFLSDNDVTIVYPIIANKTIVWLNSDNEKDLNRKSPMHYDIFHAFKELYKIKMFLDNPRLHFCFCYMNVVELKNLDGFGEDKKKYASSYDRIPIDIERIEQIESYKDFAYLFEGMDKFTVKDISKKYHSRIKDVGICFTCLSYLGLIKKVGQEGRAYVYSLSKE